MAGHPFWGLPGLQQALGCTGSTPVLPQTLEPVAAAAGPALRGAHEAPATEAAMAQLRRALSDQQGLLDAALGRAERAERQLAEQRGATEAAQAAAQRAAEAQEEAAHEAAAKADALTASMRELSDQVAALQEQLGSAEGRAAGTLRELRQARERAASAEAQVQQLQQQLYGAARGYRGWWWGSEAVRANHTPPPPPPLPPPPAPAQQGGKGHTGWQPPPPPEPPPSAPQHCPSHSSDSDGWQPAASPRQQQHSQQGSGRSLAPSLSPLQQQGGQPPAGPPPDRQPSRHLWVGNLPSSLSDSSGPWLLWQEFVPFGQIESVYVGRHPSRDDLGYAIVNYSAASSATAAMQALDDRAVPRLAGSAPLVLRYAAPPKSSSRGASAPTTPRAAVGQPLHSSQPALRHASSEPSLPHPLTPPPPPPPPPCLAAQAQQAHCPPMPLPLPLPLPVPLSQAGAAPAAHSDEGTAATPTSAGLNASSAASAAAWHLAVKLPGPEELHAVEEEEGEDALAAPAEPAGRAGAASPPVLRPSAQPFEPQQG